MLLRSIFETTNGIAALTLPVLKGVSSCLHYDAWKNRGLEFLAGCRTRVFAGSVCAAERRGQPLLSANIRLMFHAMVTKLHSPSTLSSPRNRNWRKPITDLMIPNTGSGVCLRKA
jgi:hypothetical protein